MSKCLRKRNKHCQLLTLCTSCYSRNVAYKSSGLLFLKHVFYTLFLDSHIIRGKILQNCCQLQECNKHCFACSTAPKGGGDLCSSAFLRFPQQRPHRSLLFVFPQTLHLCFQNCWKWSNGTNCSWDRGKLSIKAKLAICFLESFS